LCVTWGYSGSEGNAQALEVIKIFEILHQVILLWRFHLRQEPIKRSDILFKSIVVILLLTGVALIITEMEFRTIVQASIMTVGKLYQLVILFFVSLITKVIESVEFSDMLGSALIAWALGMTLSRLRKHMLSTAPETRTCPSCHQKLNRIHRNRTQRMLSKLFRLRSRHYQCDSCGRSSWQFAPRQLHIHQG
jgi:ribosomal protein L34E